MISLIKNEITKIFKKKSIYVMLILIFGFTILTNIIYKYVINNSINNEYYYSDSYIATLKEDIKSLNPDKPEDLMMYIDYKTDIETYELLNKYDKNSWQCAVIANYGRNYISDLNYSTYQNKDSESIANAKEKYDEFITRIESGDWRKFAEDELKVAKESLAYSPEDNFTKMQIETLQMRLDYNIDYGNNYKNEALSIYSSVKSRVLEYEQTTNMTFNEKKSYQESKAEMEKSKYVIENDKDILNESSLRGRMLGIYTEYELFIVITIILIAGAIVSEEFNKGTIKLLLIRPYSRAKILLAKFIVVLLTIVFVILVVAIMQLVIGGIFFGFNSLNIPVVEYDHSTNSIVEMNVFENIILITLGKLPKYLLLGTLAFAISTIFTNTAVAITVSILGYMASSIINQIAFYYEKAAFLKYFVTPNWDLTQFFYGKLPNMKGTTTVFAITICAIYFLIMIWPTFMVFRKKNIKNI